MKKKLFPGLILLSVQLLLAGCSSEQWKAGTYEALHKREQIKCREAGHGDCPGYDSYPDYQRKRKETQQDTD